MSTTKLRIPSYRRHKPTGYAVVTISGRDIYLGKFNSAESRLEYNRLIAEWTAGNGSLPSAGTGDVTIAELLAAFVKHARRYYNCTTPKPSGEFANYVHAIRHLKTLYARTPLAEFTPTRLKAVREKMAADDWSRQYVNRSVARLRHVFKWGVENEMVPPNVLHGLQAVAALRYGRTEVRESEQVKPVPDAFVDAVLPFVSPVVAAMIELQRLTGMRSGEVTAMRGGDINVAGKVWVYSPSQHKTAFRGHQRKIYLGPQAQKIVKPFLRADTGAYLFSPAETMARLSAARHAARKTPLSCGNVPGSNRRRTRKLGAKYNTPAYRRAISRGVAAANKALLAEAKDQGFAADSVDLVPDWHPHQLRHNAATNLRREHGIEIARIILGHRSAVMTEVYAEVDHARAIELMAKIG